jgi:hypothetical protein
VATLFEPSSLSRDDVNARIARRRARPRFEWNNPRLTAWIVASVFVLMTARLAAFVDRYAVNVVFWDQWDFLQGLFDGADAWTLFRWQHGPQRQGVGNLITAVIYSVTGWNGRADAAASVVVLVLSAAAALWLVKRVCGTLKPWDAVVPMIFLTTSSAQTYVVTPNMAHGPLPVFLLVTFGLALTIRSHSLRCISLVIVNFFAVNTGFTLLLGSVTPVMLVLQARASPLTARERAISAASVAASIGTLALFFNGFILHTASDCFQFPHRRPLEYLPYIGFVFGRPFGLNAGNTAARLLAGSVIAVGVAGFVGYAGLRLLQTRGHSVLWTVCSSLAGFALLFAATTAVGRVCLGFDSANATRYIPYVLPGILALYLVIRAAAPKGGARTFVVLAGFVLACTAKELSTFGVEEAATYHRFKQRWRDCYLATHDIEVCDARAGHPIYPEPAATHLQEKLDWLEARKYSLFQDP